jgi:hypothetical protein
LIIQNSYKNVKIYAIFEGIGLNPSGFLDFVKVYLTMAVLGNSWLLRSPIQVLEQACECLIKTIESNYKNPKNFSGVKFTMLLVLQNKEIYCASMGDIKAVLYINKKKMHLEDIAKNLQMVELTE